jgi:CheY-like chemotaxis protein
VLIVDDNVTAASMLELLLNNLGCDDVQLAHDGAAALAVADRQQPEIILLDIGLPHTSGYEVARELRARPEHNGTLLVALTGYGSEEDRRRSLEAGFDEHRVKPLSVDDLQRLLAHPKLARGRTP